MCIKNLCSDSRTVCPLSSTYNAPDERLTSFWGALTRGKCGSSATYVQGTSIFFWCFRQSCLRKQSVALLHRAFNETTMNLLTPESIPSLSALSSASDDPGDVKRALFQTPESSSRENPSPVNHIKDDDIESVLSDFISDDTSTGVNSGCTYESSSQWPVTSRNPFYFPTCQGVVIASPQELADGVFRLFQNDRYSDKALLGETVSPSSTAADSGTEPSSTDDFEAERLRSAAFGEDNMAGIGAEPDALTEVTSNVDHSVINWDRRIETLERECATLKDIIRSDSVRILQLRTKLEAARGHGQRGNFRKQRVLEILKRENAALLAQESQLLETIAELRAKIMELENMQNNKCLTMSNETELLRLQNELLANQIVTNEADLHALSLENTELKEQLVKDATTPGHPKTIEDDYFRDTLQDQLSALVVQITEIGKERERRDKVIEEDNRQIHDELAAIAIIHPPSSPHQSDDQDYKDEMGTKVEPCGCDDVEVTLEGQIITTNSMLDDKENYPTRVPNIKALADDDQDGFCGCLQSLSLSGKD